MAATEVRLRDEELQVDRVGVSDPPAAAEPSSAAATFDLARLRLLGNSRVSSMRGCGPAGWKTQTNKHVEVELDRGCRSKDPEQRKKNDQNLNLTHL